MERFLGHDSCQGDLDVEQMCYCHCYWVIGGCLFPSVTLWESSETVEDTGNESSLGTWDRNYQPLQCKKLSKMCHV